MSARRFVSVVSCLVAIACGGTSSASITASQYGVDLGAALCARGIQCCAGQSGVPTQANCAAFYSTIEQDYISQEIATGRVSFDASVGSACIAAVSDEPCEELNTYLPSVCNSALIGMQANGAACQYGVECQSTLCLNESGAGFSEPVPGTCGAQAAAGQACGVSASTENSWIDNQQDQGSLCASGSYPSIIVTGNGSGTPPCTCIAMTANGAACPTAGSQGCLSGYCDPTTSVCATQTQSSTLLDAQQCSSFFNPD